MPIRNIKLTIEYDGSGFNGWQVQAQGHRTVQGEIEKALEKICKQRVIVTGSGRTDSGVHALGQVANFKTTSKLSVSTFLRALNAHLPADIAIVDIEAVRENFHAQFSAKSKTYRYTILNRKTPSALYRHTCLFYPYLLNIRAMQTEAKFLIGQKDFKSFAAADSDRRRKRKNISTVRTVKRVTVKKNGDFITIDIEASGFLYKMVRNIVGTLLEIGSGHLSKGSIKKILDQKDRKAASKTALAQGLCLVKVKY